MKDNKPNEILNKYTGTKESAKEVNAELKKNGYSLFIDYSKSFITPEEHEAGWGWLDTGTGSLDKCKADMSKMELEFDDMGEMFALFIYGEDTYEVKGKKLILK